MAKFKCFGNRSDKTTILEEKNRNLAKKIASEGIVLLKNEGVLPLKNKKVALYGNGARMTIKGGTGSGDVRERYSVNIETGLKNLGCEILTNTWLDRFDNDFNKKQNEFLIPKVIHQIYEDPKGPPEFLLQSIQTWKELHPDWQYRFWGKKDIRNFLETEFPDFIPIYDAYPFNVQRWDAIRYLILYKIGGLYVDMDYECIRPLDGLLVGNTCCIGMEPTLNAVKHKKPFIIGNALMASIPGHKYFELIIQDLIHNRNTVFSGYDSLQIIETTGPFLTTRVYENMQDKSDVTLLSADLVAPLTMEEVRMMFNDQNIENIDLKVDKAFAIHYFLGTWVPQTYKTRMEKEKLNQ